jgi:hypothetical protein
MPQKWRQDKVKSVIPLPLAKLNLPHIEQRYASRKPIFNTPNTMPTTKINLHRPYTITTNLDFRWACYTAYLMLVLLIAGVAVSAFYAARKQLSRDKSLMLLLTFGYTVFAWLLILVGIHTCWPDGRIYKRRLRKGLGSEMGMPAELLPGVAPPGVAEPV